MIEKVTFREKELFEVIYTSLDLKALMSDDAYDLYINSDSCLWLDDDGVIYEFLDIEPCERDFVRSYADWEEFNKVYPK